ncbi:hypothetical protein ABID65_006695 [Bradyrhizobium sp. S3.9.2]|uniref:hypothetical protein n=1 Tax=Bradyrhizobium sp. S3.9.2 TaxID=3156432 RepID=UPI003395C291
MPGLAHQKSKSRETSAAVAQLKRQSLGFRDRLMRKIAITREELAAKVLAAVQAHQGCESVKEIAITPVQIVGSGLTWHASLVDSGFADPQLAASVVRQTGDDLEPKFALTEHPCGEG